MPYGVWKWMLSCNVKNKCLIISQQCIPTINEYKINIFVTHNRHFAEYILFKCNIEHFISTWQFSWYDLIISATTRHYVYHILDTSIQCDCVYIIYRGYDQKKRPTARCTRTGAIVAIAVTKHTKSQLTMPYGVWKWMLSCNVKNKCLIISQQCIPTINEYKINIFVTHNRHFAEYILLKCNIEHFIST